MNQDTATKPKRLLSLDVLRGLTVFGMVLVNNGGGKEHFEMLKHCKWNGMTPCDLVFPFFLFMVGVSIYLSLSKQKALAGMPCENRNKILLKILKRTCILFFIGVALHAWDMIIWGETDILPHLRITGVLQRIALCYGITSVILLYCDIKRIWQIALGLLIIYSGFLIWANGYATDETNIANLIDKAIIGEAHLYHKGPIDPEGLFGVIPSISHTMIGVLIGKIILSKDALEKRLLKILTWSFILLVAAYLLQFGLPLNKRVWSPSYVFASCGLASGLLAIFTIIIDMKGYQKWCRIFQMFGMNAFGLYTISEMIPSVFGKLGISEALWSGIRTTIPSECWASLVYALCFDAIMAFIAWILWKKKIFIKI